jgi:hypothetical protein
MQCSYQSHKQSLFRFQCSDSALRRVGFSITSLRNHQIPLIA